MPSPTYQYAKYSEWIVQFVKDRHNSTDIEIHTDLVNLCRELLNKYEEESKQYTQEVSQSHKEVSLKIILNFE